MISMNPLTYFTSGSIEAFNFAMLFYQNHCTVHAFSSTHRSISLGSDIECVGGIDNVMVIIIGGRNNLEYYNSDGLR